jgi:hypothetical protein
MKGDSKRIGSIALAVAVSPLLALAANAPAQRYDPARKSAAFERLQSLAGSWYGTSSFGSPVHVEYEVVSSGSSLLERLSPTSESEMVTLYAPDGARLTAVHYCNAGNQPQMQTAPLTGVPKRFTFTFVRATNLAGPDAGHMHQLIITLEDHDHFMQEWTWMEGKKAHTELFRFTRKTGETRG